MLHRLCSSWKIIQLRLKPFFRERHPTEPNTIVFAQIIILRQDWISQTKWPALRTDIGCHVMGNLGKKWKLSRASIDCKHYVRGNIVQNVVMAHSKNNGQCVAAPFFLWSWHFLVWTVYFAKVKNHKIISTYWSKNQQVWKSYSATSFARTLQRNIDLFPPDAFCPAFINLRARETHKDGKKPISSRWNYVKMSAF